MTLDIDIEHLDDRSVLSVSGVDAQTFLQNIFTNDVRRIVEGVLQYTLLLSPQGQVLHDVFIFVHNGRYYLDVETTRKADLLRRMNMYKLRAAVEIAESDMQVIAMSGGGEGYADPRTDKLGRRIYGSSAPQTTKKFHEALCLSLGVPNGSRTIRYGSDFAHDVNLDRLNAFSWTKGCFIGQEVAARVENKGLVKRRLMIVKEAPLDDTQNDIRQKSNDGKAGLAVLRVDQANGTTVRLPDIIAINDSSNN